MDAAVVSEEASLPAGDGYPLAATVHAPRDAAPAGAVVLGSATGVRRQFYDRFAAHLAARGLGVVTFDYRGIGGSRPERLRGFRATMRDWGSLDAASALDWASRRWPGAPVLWVGHSFGGQLVGLLPAPEALAGIVLVGAQSGWWGHWPARTRAAYAVLWRAFPAVAGAMGRFPFSMLGMGEDLPAGVAREWARWCRSPGYLTDHVPGARDAFRAVRSPVLALGFTDDSFAPRRATEALLRWMENARIEHRHLAPADVGARAVGHFGFFRRGVAPRLWDEVATWLLDRAARGAAPLAPPTPARPL